MSSSLAVVVCTHNPRSDYLARTLEGLRLQSFPADQWELVVVDNASTKPVAAAIDLSWHPNGRCVVESALGLTRARVRGVRAATAPLLVFVDDDNVLAPDYLANAVEIGSSHPFLGAWGGSSIGVYEVPPPDFVLCNAHMLAVRDVPSDFWSNTKEDFRSVPCGAGMCIRRSVVELWLDDLSARPDALRLGRAGQNLSACEDGHLALTSAKLGLGTGVFARLSLHHLIPKERMTLEYFTRLAAGHAYSYNFLRHLLGQEPFQDSQRCFSERLYNLYRDRSVPAANRAIENAMKKARARSVKDLAEIAGKRKIYQ
jgi:glycosyltransferase involved in cell wall biosynthesis